MQGVKKLGVKPMEDIVVIGAGTMGLVNAQVAKAFGARVIITEIDPRKIERAQEDGHRRCRRLQEHRIRSQRSNV